LHKPLIDDLSDLFTAIALSFRCGKEIGVDLLGDVEYV
jgi:hypothetical protein